MKAILKLNKIVPKYSHAILLFMLLVNFITYYVTRLFTTSMPHINLSFQMDSYIPFLPGFIVIYLLAFIQWVAGYIIIARENEEVCCRVLSGEIFAKLMCMLIFILFPTTMVRPDVTGNDIFSQLVCLIYATDPADNLFPSIHCLESWLCFRGAVPLKKVGRSYKALTFVFTCLVFASVVFVKQHVIIDIIGGIAVAELGLFLSRCTGFYRLFYRFCKRGKVNE